MRGIVYFKLQNVGGSTFQQNENNEFHVQIASYLVVLGFALILHFCGSQDISLDDRTYGCCHNLFYLYFSLFAFFTLPIIQVIWGEGGSICIKDGAY